MEGKDKLQVREGSKKILAVIVVKCYNRWKLTTGSVTLIWGGWVIKKLMISSVQICILMRLQGQN